MAKKSDKYSGMQDMFFQQEIDEKNAQFESARAKLEKEIQDIEQSSKDNDSGQTVVEDRNEINNLRNEIRRLEQEHIREIAELKSKMK